ncbi:hypothetical protein IWZ01DRAFT_89882 [Phyllosticta capitalensis]
MLLRSSHSRAKQLMVVLHGGVARECVYKRVRSLVVAFILHPTTSTATATVTATELASSPEQPLLLPLQSKHFSIVQFTLLYAQATYLPTAKVASQPASQSSCRPPSSLPPPPPPSLQLLASRPPPSPRARAPRPSAPSPPSRPRTSSSRPAPPSAPTMPSKSTPTSVPSRRDFPRGSLWSPTPATGTAANAAPGP